MSLIVLFIALLIMLMLGVPIGFAIGGSTMLSMYYCTDLNMVINAQYCYSGISSFTVMAIPFFMLAGLLMSTGGIAKRIVNVASALIDFVTGALGCVTILSCMFFGALSGSGMATASAIGGMMIPEMKRKGYDPAYAATVVCFGGIVGPIIPPSLSFVLYGATTGTSVPNLFLGGILPGIFLGLGYLVVNIMMCKKLGFEVRSSDKSEDNEMVPMKVLLKERLRKIWTTTKEGFWALLSPVIILGGIYSGIFTPTEAACISVVYSAIISLFVYKEMNYKQLLQVLIDSAVINGITSFLLGYSTVFSTFLTFEKVPQIITASLSTFTNNPYVILLLINMFLLVLGCFLDTVPAVIIIAPMLFPTIKAMGIHPVHFGVVMAVNLAIGLCTPPYGCNLFVGAAVAKIKMESMMKYIVPYMIASVIMLMIITYVPWLSLAFLK